MYVFEFKLGGDGGNARVVKSVFENCAVCCGGTVLVFLRLVSRAQTDSSVLNLIWRNKNNNKITRVDMDVDIFGAARRS